ncbi:MAG: XRE family transcriptional regulator [Chloroflexi bacterium]|nr:XRE family transcriptional regulator [Chloroflexota bacterium]
MYKLSQSHPDPATLGQLLQQACKRQGMTQADAAEVLGVSRPTMTAVENGTRPLKASELIKLAEAYGRDVSDFVRARPILQPFAAQFRSAVGQTTADDEAAIATTMNQLEDLVTNYVELEQMTDSPLPKHYPPIYRYQNRRTEQAAEALAIGERNRLGLGDAPIPSLRDTLEQAVGLRIFYLPFASYKYSAAYFFEPTHGGCIALNEQHPAERSRLSLAHEYAHFLADRTEARLTFDGQYQRVPESERFADAFAVYFLMPTSGVTTRFNALYEAQGRITPADLVRLADYYGASVEAMVYRLEGMKLIPSGTWGALQRREFKVKEARAQIGLRDSYPEPQQRLPQRYTDLAIAAYRREAITLGGLAYFLQVDLLDARELVAQPIWQADLQATVQEDVFALA